MPNHLLLKQWAVRAQCQLTHVSVVFTQARLHERCLGAHGAADEVARMRRQLARDKSELEAHLAQVMGLLFPQVGLSLCVCVCAPRVCAKDLE